MNIWSRIKSIYTGEHKWFTWFVTVALLLFVYSWLFGQGNTIFHWINARKTVQQQELQMEEYRRQIEEMNHTMNQRQTDRDTLEKFAREQYEFAAPGEDVYILEE